MPFEALPSLPAYKAYLLFFQQYFAVYFYLFMFFPAIILNVLSYIFLAGLWPVIKKSSSKAILRNYRKVTLMKRFDQRIAVVTGAMHGWKYFGK